MRRKLPFTKTKRKRQPQPPRRPLRATRRNPSSRRPSPDRAHSRAAAARGPAGEAAPGPRMVPTSQTRRFFGSCNPASPSTSTHPHAAGARGLAGAAAPGPWVSSYSPLSSIDTAASAPLPELQVPVTLVARRRLHPQHGWHVFPSRASHPAGAASALKFMDLRAPPLSMSMVGRHGSRSSPPA